ncbi:MAG: Bor/Iss family lipoprotein [Cyclobacteriaceae bacterium]
MKPAIKSILKSAALLIICTQLVGCFATHHTVGEGGTYEGNEIEKYDLKKKKWYLFWGGVPLDEVRADQLAGDAKNYTVRETFSFGDLLLNGLTFGIASPRTIRVSKSVEEK